MELKASTATMRLNVAAAICLLGVWPFVVRGNDKCLAPSPVGCFVDPYQSPAGAQRVLKHAASLSIKNMTQQHCIALCCKAGFGVGSLAGLEDGGQCYCDHSLGPYTIPQDPAGCTEACNGSAQEKCGAKNRMLILGITGCPALDNNSAALDAFLQMDGPMTSVKKCGANGCTSCPAEDTCCVGHSPDAYRVPGGFGCAPPNSTNTPGCASGGVFSTGCCCGPGPAMLSTTDANVLIIGDSVSAGYIGSVKSALLSVANVQHGPDNSGGGNADGVGYGQLCAPYFLRTPQYVLPAWDVITFNFGLHDGQESNVTYRHGLQVIADIILAAASSPVLGRKKPAEVIYFLTTIPGGSGSVPGEPVSPDDKRVQELNAIAQVIMSERNIPVVDLYATMVACGDACKACKPHCSPAGYQYLTDHAIAPAVKRALGNRTMII